MVRKYGLLTPFNSFNSINSFKSCIFAPQFINYKYGIYRISQEIPPDDLRHRRRSGSPDDDAEERGEERKTRPRLPLLRSEGCRQDHLCTYLRQGHQLPEPDGRRRGLQRVRVVPVVQRAAFTQHLRARRRLEQLRGAYQDADGADTHPAAARTLQGVHHRRGAHALNSSFQRFPQDTRRAARTRHLHPRHNGEAQDPAHHPQPMPDLRLRTDDHPQHCRSSEACSREGRHHLRGRSAGGHWREGRRWYARCPLHL